MVTLPGRLCHLTKITLNILSKQVIQQKIDLLTCWLFTGKKKNHTELMAGEYMAFWEGGFLDYFLDGL